MNNVPLPVSLDLTASVLLALYEGAEVAARAAWRAHGRRSPAPQRGGTLRPGSRTPLWNEVRSRALPHLAKHGEKAKLARILGLPRQRLQDYLKAGRSAPDAERTLLLLCWVVAREQGRELTS